MRDVTWTSATALRPEKLLDPHLLGLDAPSYAIFPLILAVIFAWIAWERRADLSLARR